MRDDGRGNVVLLRSKKGDGQAPYKDIVFIAPEPGEWVGLEEAVKDS